VSGTPSAAHLERLRAAAAKAEAMARRPVTAADVESWLALAPDWRAAANDPARQEALLLQHQLTLQEWRVLDGRIATLVLALERGTPHEKLAADMETARPFLERLQAARKPR
jgi:hypothetical protein